MWCWVLVLKRQRPASHSLSVPPPLRAPFRHTPHTVRGPRGSSTEGPSGRVRMASPPHFGTPLTRFVAL
eukprot:5364786-Pyramimonas_sp.AAC.1